MKDNLKYKLEDALRNIDDFRSWALEALESEDWDEVENQLDLLGDYLVRAEDACRGLQE